MEDFLAKTVEEVACRLGGTPEDFGCPPGPTFLDEHPEVRSNTSAIILMDIEGPVGVSQLHRFREEDQRAIVEAYKVRVRATRAVFKHASLALWGTLHPDPEGRADGPTYKERLEALKRAGTWGLYDDLDYLAPVLYVRFGPSDDRWDTLDDYTQLGVDGSRQLADLPLLPFLTFWLIQPTVPRCDVLRDECELLINLEDPEPVQNTLREQIRLLEENGVMKYVLWTPLDRNELTGPTEPSTVTAYFCELYPKPWCPTVRP